MEVTPLFTYLSSPSFNLTSITIPMYFISKESHHNRSTTRPGYALPLKSRYWVQVCVHALCMLIRAPDSGSLAPQLQEVRVKYLPWDIWASMDPADDLRRMTSKGVWLDGADAAEGGEREVEGEAFRAAWTILREKGLMETLRAGVEEPEISFVKWDGNVDSGRVGDELEVVFRRRSDLCV